MRMNRREFVGWMSMGAIATSVISCASDQQTNSETEETTREDGFQAVGPLEELEAKGSLTDEMGQIIVIRSSNNDLIALDRRCPHQGCAVSLNEAGEQLICPCHDSRFTIRGELLKGPATTGLPSYEVKTEDNLVLVKTSSN